MISGYDGKVVSIAGNALRMSYCPHDICLGDLCGVCGRRVAKVSEFSGSEKSGGIAGGRGIGQGQISINVEGGNALQVSRDAAEGKRRKTVERLFQQRKLALVLDLDHTLVHATNDARAMDFAKFKNVSAGVFFEGLRFSCSDTMVSGEIMVFFGVWFGVHHWLKLFRGMSRGGLGDFGLGNV